MQQSMRACKIHAAQNLRVHEVPVPQPGPGEVLVRLGAAGICSSDMHYYFHGRVGNFMIREPLTPGHEASGGVAALGEGAAGLAIGERIAINPSRPCGHCAACREGRENLCANMRFLGSASVFPHMQGMFSEYSVMPRRQCVSLPAGTLADVSLGEIALSEPFSVALHSASRAGPLLGRRVLITASGAIGAIGAIGCMMVLAARLAGAAHITITDVVDHLLAYSKSDVFKEMIDAYRANPTPIAFAEVYLALQSGTVEAQENPLTAIEAKKCYEVQKHIMLTGHIIDGLVTQIGRHVWAELTDEFKKKGLNIVPVDRAGLQQAVLEPSRRIGGLNRAVALAPQSARHTG